MICQERSMTAWIGKLVKGINSYSSLNEEEVRSMEHIENYLNKINLSV